MVSSLVPKNDVITHKRLKNLRKLQERRKKAGERIEDEDDDGDSDDGLGFKIKSKPKTIDEILADSDEEEMEVEQVTYITFNKFISKS
jgi:ribosomal RNA-processing protein 12